MCSLIKKCLVMTKNYLYDKFLVSNQNFNRRNVKIVLNSSFFFETSQIAGFKIVKC